jgi:hypothetical protein
MKIVQFYDHDVNVVHVNEYDNEDKSRVLRDYFGSETRCEVLPH